MAQLEVITGPMFSGKTEELMRRLRRATYARRKIIIFKPDFKDRHDLTNEIAVRQKSDDGIFKVVDKLPAIVLPSFKDALFMIRASKPKVVGVDEGQFLQEWFLELVDELLNYGGYADLTIIVSGLDMDAWRKPFGIIPQLLAAADEVTKLKAKCFQCGNDAIFTQKVGGTKEQVQVGDYEIYEARCRGCHTMPD